MEPKEAVDEYIESREHENAKATIQNYTYRLERFLEFCEDAGIDDLSVIDGRTAELYKKERLTADDINMFTAEQQLRTFRLFLRWCEANEFVKDGVADKMIIPSTETEDKVRNKAIDRERADKIVETLYKYQYASRRHIVFHLLWHTGMRGGSLHALDVEDWNSDEKYIEIHHRPESGTPLKLKSEGERHISVTDEDLAVALDDYVEKTRPGVEDDYGREPLIATEHGRAAKGTIRKDVYKIVQPCRYEDECPHDEEIQSCEYRDHDNLFGCPSSLYPHAIRSGAITAHLNEDVPKAIVSERTNVSEAVLEKHYDERSLEEKRERRRKYL